MRKRIISVVCVVAMFLLLFPSSSMADSDFAKAGQFNTISMGALHCAAIGEDGSLYIWGGPDGNHRGQLGLGYTSASDERIAIPPTKLTSLSDVVSISTGGEHSAAITADGSLYTWGAGTSGQLGHGNTEDLNVPTKVESLSNVIGVSLGYNSSAAITADGSLYTWGDNRYYGVLGLGFASELISWEDDIYDPIISVPTKVEALSDVTAVSMNGVTGAAITSDGSLYTWGLGYHLGHGVQLVPGEIENIHTPTKVETLSDVIFVNMGANHGTAITANGDFYTWGSNTFAGLGIDNAADVDNEYGGSVVITPTKVTTISNVISTSLQSLFPRTIALTADGSVYQSTREAEGVNGYFDKIEGFSNIVAVSTYVVNGGASSTIALTADGELYVEGNNLHGVLPDTGYSMSPPTLLLSNIKLPNSVTPSSPISPPNTPNSWAVTEVNAALDAGLVPDSISNAGWQNSTSRLAAAEAMVVLIEKVSWKTMAQIASERGWDLNANGFSDTSSQAVTFLKHAGITTGIGENLYDPTGSYTRAHIVTMIGRTAEMLFAKTVQGSNPFTDVPDWAAPYVGYAADNGITQGVGGGLFDPDSNLQNQQTAVFAYRTFNVLK